MSIRLKLILSICIPMILGFGALLYWDYQHSYQRATEFAQQRVAERAVGMASQLEEKLNSIKISADGAAEYFESRNNILSPQLRGVLMSTMRPGSWVSGTIIAFAPTYQRGANVPQVVGMRRPQAGPSDNPGDRGPGERGPGDRGPNDRAFGLENLETILDGQRVTSSWFTKPRDLKKGTWIDPQDIKFPNIEPNRISAYCVPFFTSGDTFAGVIAVCLTVNDLQHLRDEQPIMVRLRGLQGRRTAATNATSLPSEPKATPLNEGGYVILDQHGNLISHPDGVQINDFTALAEKINPALGEGIHKSLKGAGEILTVNNLDQLISGYSSNEEYVLALQPLQSSGWVFVTAVPKSELLGPIQTLLINRATLFGLLMLFPIGLVAFVSRRFCKPIEKMAKRVQEISQGNLDTPPIDILAKDEIGRLAGGFNLMTDQLRSHIAALTEQSAAREKVESELRIARQIQSDLLPRTFPPFPDRPEFDLHALNQPARHIAGDFFDFFFVNHDKLFVVIADVSGKGIPAALLMAVTRTIIRNFASEGLSPKQIVERANQMLFTDSEPGMFVTLIVGEYSTSTGEFRYVNAGHPCALRLGKSSGIECLPTGPLVGVSIDGELGGYEEKTIVLQPGEGLLFYTDGITEARYADKLYGESRLMNFVSASVTDGCQTICTKVAQEVSRYQHDQLADDVTIVAIKRIR